MDSPLVNLLSHEISPYLQQHKDNPVAWLPWGQDAFEAARKRHLPILLSIGYSSCHWCHVMAHESFEDNETAQIMNQHFINIKVDREERPDVDEIYMEAVQILTGQGGWPLTVFLTPDLKPFFGGTYFPKTPKHGMPAFKEVLLAVSRFYHENANEVQQKTQDFHVYFESIKHQHVLIEQQNPNPDTPMALDTVVELFWPFYARLLDALDLEKDRYHGGFGRAPKFVQPAKFSAFLSSEKPEHISFVLFSLAKICTGGITDQIGGGICRYSVDATWTVPHFEKMLYDNAQFLKLLAAGALFSQHTGDAPPPSFFIEYASSLCRYLETNLKDSFSGLYFSAEDADSEGKEGLFYTFTHAEFVSLFKENMLLKKFAETYFQVSPHGNFEGTNILTVPPSFEHFCHEQGLSFEEGHNLKEQAQKVLLEGRAQRVRPGLDNKCLLSWNALLATAFLQSATLFNEPQYLISGLNLLKDLLNAFQKDGSYWHYFAQKQVKVHAFLDDLGFLLESCVEAILITGCQDLLQETKKIILAIDRTFRDETKDILYYAPQDSSLFQRPTKPEDNVIYSANSAIFGSLTRLFGALDACGASALFSQAEREKAEKLATTALSNTYFLATRSPTACAQILQHLPWCREKNVIVIHPAPQKGVGLRSLHEGFKLLYQHRCPARFLIAVEMNTRFTVQDLAKYASLDYDSPAQYSLCNVHGCQRSVAHIEQLKIN